MTLFDVIRYPVSNPPTEEELDNLPSDVFNKWTEWMGWYTAPRSMAYLFRERIKDEDPSLVNRSIAHLQKLLLARA